MKFDLSNAFPEEVGDFMASLGEKPYRAKQLYHWVHNRHGVDFDEMANLPKELRKRLAAAAFIGSPSISEKKTDGNGTIKYLFEMRNHNIIDTNEVNGTESGSVFVESVLMDYRHGAAVCVSTQAGCSMGCSFCSSGKSGLLRNLSPGEMLGQVYAIAKDSGKTISNVTLMGCGEPLDNYTNTLRFIRLLSVPEGLGLGQRRITLSTCGLTKKILALAEEKLQITLAVSLHGPNDNIRLQLMPVARAFPMKGLLDACRVYGEKTKRRITFEYAMIMGKNDRTDHAAELAAKLSKILCHVNLLPMNPVSCANGDKKLGLRPSPPNNISAFRDILQKHGIETTIRRSLGSGINAACGQLVAGMN